jgi:oligoendopeptidase F
MPPSLPQNADELMRWSWPDIEPHYQALAARDLSAANVNAWLADWSRLTERVSEMEQRLYVATTVNTADAEAERRYKAYWDEIYPVSQAAEQALKEKLLASGLEPERFDVPLRNMRAEAALFREANLPLLAEEQKLRTEYDKIVGAQTVMWEGREVTLPQLHPVYQDPDRAVRERAWRLAAQRQLADREAVNALWVKFLSLRRQLAINAGLGDDYRAYRWRQVLRFDYTPEDCQRFHQAIETVVVPAARRTYERRRQRLGLKTLRPWDLADGWYGRPIDPPNLAPLRPFHHVAELEDRSAAIFQRVDPRLGEHFDVMRREGLLDLDNRKNKAPGGYCTHFAAVRRPFIFMNAVGLHDDVQTMLHEAGHAFHVFESGALPYIQQLQVGAEFAEVASMGMELLAAPYLATADRGFYTEADAARARVEHLERSLLFWPFMAVVDAFQHWAYANAETALDPAICDAQWGALWDRFMAGVDWTGLEPEKVTGWHRKLHIHQEPFYYVEYGLALLGAVQVWRNALRDQAQAVADYRRALALGGTVPLPDLYAAAGARFAFEAGILREAVSLMEETIARLESQMSGNG